MNILLVEDETRVADFVRRGLQGEGWAVEHAGDGRTALDLVKTGRYDAIVLDLMLPDISGQDVCKRLRASGNTTPVLMLTALDAVDDRVAGLRMGADDYLAKPFDFDELVARLEALSRRKQGFDKDSANHMLQFGEINFDTDAMVVRTDGKATDLTAKEREILKLFMLNPEKVISRERILSAAWGANEDPLTNIVDVYIARLRKKLGRSGAMVQTVRGSGYRLARMEQ